jgi:hypothetical protein
MYVRFSRGFDSAEDLPAVSTARLAGLIKQNHAELVAAECRMLQLACAWADAHYLDSSGEDYQPLSDGPVRGVVRGRPRCRSIAPPSWARCRAPE